MAYTVINELSVELENVPLFEKNFEASMRGTLGDVEGLESAQLLCPQTAGRGYLSVLNFSSQRAYENYLKSPAFAAAHSWPEHAPFEGIRLAEFSELVHLEYASTNKAAKSSHT